MGGKGLVTRCTIIRSNKKKCIVRMDTYIETSSTTFI